MSSSHNTRFALRYRVNLLLADRSAPMRVVGARSAAERKMLGRVFPGGVIVRDHVDLYELVNEMGALRPGEKITD